MRTLIAGGGTGGHLTPALAVAQALRAADPTGDVTVVGRRGGVAEELVAAAGLPLVTIPISGLDFSSVRSVAEFSGRMPAAVLQSLRLLRRHRPHVVVGTAGYVSVPVVAAARIAHIPVVLLEQNALPGRATHLLARSATAVATSFEETGALLPRGPRAVVTGNPVRQDIVTTEPAALGDRCRSVLVMGGSQGARRLNQAVEGSLARLLEGDPELILTHQTGALDIDRHLQLRERLPAGLRERYRVEAFFDALAPVVAAADLVVMRSGGSSLAEVTILGRPMVLVPYPHAGGHQRHNAAPYVAAGAASLVDDADFSGERFESEVRAMVTDPASWRRRAASSHAMGRPGAAFDVARLVAEVARERMAAAR